MQFSLILVALASASAVVADLHTYATCNSHIQPIGNPNTCPASKRDTTPNEAVNLRRSRIMGRAYGDNAAATEKACAAYKARNTGTNKWDTCPDCTMGVRKTSDPKYCVQACNSAAGHIGGDEWLYYCKQAGADESEAY
ncbi:hypothetical protein CkaCkLH20_07572 [Colletotrichum karsti]|uniref:Uncharacterized protein n=1 Tax=Colletotrichum karsti TaxID=1095194 RepID=A0A9P6I1S8_9PEZI|nr:uncharacterized protein CkaCkLH20_07572 [Colletotrichum karsti]KAF9874878.1 hypothetical protein CkaCkLH20_07572 [Colletotrichum karsti]